MNRFLNIVVAALIVWGGAAQVQAGPYDYSFPLPADHPVTCPVCTLPTYPYKAPVKFLGRWLDSVYTGTYQQPFRTARALTVHTDHQTQRIYVLIGSSCSVYDINKFFTRASLPETLMLSTEIPVVGGWDPVRAAAPDKFLKWDKWWYGENTQTGWQIPITDGQQKMSGFSNDDRGYVYLNTAFGWGIVYDNKADDAGLMPSSFQRPDTATRTATEVSSPEAMSPVRSGNNYYLLIAGNTPRTVNVWNVTDTFNPVRLSDLPTLGTWVTSNDRVAYTNTTTSNLYIDTVDGLLGSPSSARNVFPPPSDSGKWGTFTTDGTNFYAMDSAPNGTMRLTVFKPDSTHTRFTSTMMSTGLTGTPYRLSVDGGYVGLEYADNSFVVDMAFFRMGDTALSQIAVDNYFRKYYTAAPTGYMRAPNTFLLDGSIVVQNGHLYAIIAGQGVGDLYEITTSDQLSLFKNEWQNGQWTLGNPGSVTTPATPNPNAPSNGVIYYGDAARFQATSTAPSTSAPKSVQWNFGNPQSGSTVNQPLTVMQPSGSGQASVVDHRYSGIKKVSPATIPQTVTVTATDPTGGPVPAVSFTLAAPAARYGIANASGAATFKYVDAKYLLALPNASAAPPIVLGDSFFDASDGDVEGHYAQWSVTDAGITRAGYPKSTKPYSANAADYLIPVGDCGAHTLGFSAFYGAYDQNFTTIGTDVLYQESLSTLPYNVRAFAAGIDPSHPADATGKPVFHSTSRFSTTYTAADLSSLSWQWDLLDSSGNVILAGPTGSGTITDWPVDRSKTTPGSRVRLAIFAPAAMTGACTPDQTVAGKPASVALSQALYPPDAVEKGPASCSGSDCVFEVTSAGGTDMVADHWHYGWSVSPSVTGTKPDQAKFTPQFSTTGTYDVSVAVTNDVGTTTPTKVTVQYTKPVITCGQMTDAVVYPVIAQAYSACPGGTCPAGQALTFTVQANGYDFGCATHTYTWDFGDGSGTATGASVQHSFAARSTPYSVTVTIANAVQTFKTAPLSVTVGGVVIPPPPVGGCGTMTDANVYVVVSGCPGNVCPPSTPITFYIQAYGYDMSCANHSFTWNFGDGSPAVSGASTMQHSFASGGGYNVRVTISNGTQSFTTAPLTVTASGTPTQTGCGTMTDANVYAVVSGCPGNICPAGSPITFFVQANGYDLGCATHTYSWDFGDGSAPVSGGNSVQHTFSARTTPYSVRVTISNNKQQFTPAALSITASGSLPGCPAMSDVNVYPVVTPATMCPGGTCPGYQPITFTVQPNGYDFGCSTHTFTWDFGDGSPVVVGTTAQHTFTPRTDPYQVKVTIKNTWQTFTTSAVPITVKSDGRPATPSTKVTLATEALAGVGAYRFTPVVDPVGVGVNFHWEVSVGNTVIEKADKNGPVAFQPANPLTPGTTYSISVKVDDVTVGATTVTPPIQRKRPVRH